VPEAELESLLVYLTSEFFEIDSPCVVDTYKKYICAQNDNREHIYLITIKPLNRFNIPMKKRKDTDEAIKAVSTLVCEWTKTRKDKYAEPTTRVYKNRVL
jgi:hypothetical protein